MSTPLKAKLGALLPNAQCCCPQCYACSPGTASLVGKHGVGGLLTPYQQPKVRRLTCDLAYKSQTEKCFGKSQRS